MSFVLPELCGLKPTVYPADCCPASLDCTDVLVFHLWTSIHPDPGEKDLCYKVTATT